MKKYFPYDVANPAPIIDEEQTILEGKIILDHIPAEGSIRIAGFVAAKHAETLQRNEFYCDYRKDTLYREANRTVFFYRGRSGQKVRCSYLAIGSPVTAQDMNEIKDHLDNVGAQFDKVVENQREVNANFINLRQELTTKITQVEKFVNNFAADVPREDFLDFVFGYGFDSLDYSEHNTTYINFTNHVEEEVAQARHELEEFIDEGDSTDFLHYVFD